MSVSMAWYLNDSKTPFPLFVEACVDLFYARHKHKPSVCVVNPAQQFSCETIKVEFAAHVAINNVHLGPVVTRKPRQLPEDFHYEPLIR